MKQCGADSSAERVLRALPPDILNRVLHEGPAAAGGGNPSLDLMARISRHEKAANAEQAAAFLQHNFVDGGAGDSLRALPGDQLRLVLAQGPLISHDRPTELIARIQSVTGGTAVASTTAAHGTDAVAAFVRENQVDSSAEKALRDLPWDIQSKVINEGPVAGTNNPSAVLMSRIKREREGRRED